MNTLQMRTRSLAYLVYVKVQAGDDDVERQQYGDAVEKLDQVYCVAFVGRRDAIDLVVRLAPLPGELLLTEPQFVQFFRHCPPKR